MTYLTRFGTQWGQVTQTLGRLFWVAPSAGYTVEGKSYRASDGNDGLSPERAFVTVGAGVNAATMAGDTVVLLPGAHSVTASIAADTANVKITGLPGGLGNFLYPRTTIACSAVDETLNVTAAGVEISHIGFLSTTSQASALINFSAAADNLWIHHCMFDLFTATAATTILGIDAIGAANYVLVEDCSFNCDGAFGASIDMTATLDMVIRNCLFVQTAGTLAATITVGAGTDRGLIDRCTFQIVNAAAVTAVINGTGADIPSGVLVNNCIFGDRNTVPVENFAAGTCEISENYEAGLGAAGDGGVLITVIT